MSLESVSMKLNADIGENYGKWTLGNDEQIMPLIDQANIACGYHAGDALTMQQTIGLASKHQVEIGAHVSYPDIQGFGRRSMQLNHNELVAMVHAQMATLDGLAKCQHTNTTYVKPHGAMYNDMMKQLHLYESIVVAIASYHREHDLVIQALPNMSSFIEIANKYKVQLRFEAFADRAYSSDGLLVSRSKSNAVLSEKDCLHQVSAMIQGGTFLSECKKPLSLNIDTICVHSDTPNPHMLCSKVRTLIIQNVASTSANIS
ncbi:MAG: UPF0271 protein [Alphaproteobacteria bacterium]|jgi:UPF0271 protein